MLCTLPLAYSIPIRRKLDLKLIRYKRGSHDRIPERTSRKIHPLF